MQNNGGQVHRWRQLRRSAVNLADWLSWLAPMVLAVERLVTPLNTTGDSDIYRGSLIVIGVWAVGLLLFYFYRQRSTDDVKPVTYVPFMTVMVTAYTLMVAEINWSVAFAMLAIVINSVIYVNLATIIINLLGLEVILMRFYSGAWIDQMYIGSLQLLGLVGGLVYASLLLLARRYQLLISELEAEVEKPQLTDSSLVTLINNLSSAIVKVDQRLKIKIYNAALLNILDTNQTLSNLSLTNFLKIKDLSGRMVELTELLKASRTVRVFDELLLEYQTGEQIRLELTISPIKNPYGVVEDDEYILIMRDVTKIKNLDMERDEFISVVSHELRTPIAIAEASLSNLELILQQKADPHLIKNTLKKAHDQILFLSTMTNDLSSLARANRQEVLQFETLDLRQELQTLYEKYRLLTKDKGLGFDLDIDSRIGQCRTHPLYLEEILQNLLANAIKYTETGTITLRARRSAGQIEIAVVDTGVGIAKTDQVKVFDKFYRVEYYKTRQTSGTGLGLYVANKLAQKIGGRLHLQSRVGFGSTFSLVLPKDATVQAKNRRSA